MYCPEREIGGVGGRGEDAIGAVFGVEARAGRAEG